MRVLIVGCGYVGLPLGQALVQAGHQVSGLRRSASSTGELRSAGLTPIIADITRRAELDGIAGSLTGSSTQLLQARAAQKIIVQFIWLARAN